MAAAVVQVQVYHGGSGSPTIASAEGGLLYNRADDEAATLRLAVPTVAPASAYSNWKALRFAVITPGTTIIKNLGVRLFGPLPSGMEEFWPGSGDTSYIPCTGSGPTAGNRPADSGASLAASPAPNASGGWVAVPQVTAAIYDTADHATTSAVPFGKFTRFLVGVSSSYAGASSAGQTIPALVFQYDEA